MYRNKICFTDLPKIYINCVEINFVGNIKKNNRKKSQNVGEVRRLLVLQLIVPIICYSATIFGNVDATSFHKLIVAFNNATRYVAFLDM